MWRYHPGFRAIFEAARQGWLGDVFLVRGYISNNSHLRVGSSGPSTTRVHVRPGVAPRDATVRLLGKPKAVTPFLRRHGRFEDSLKDNNVAVLEYDRATAVLVNTRAASRRHAATVVRSPRHKRYRDPAAHRAPSLQLDLASPAGPYRKGSQTVSLPPYQRYEGDFAELAAAVRGERALTASLDEELLVGETLLRLSEMLLSSIP